MRAAAAAVGLLAGLLAACQSVCPQGATLKGSGPPGGTAQWCELEDTDLRAALPMMGRGPVGAQAVASLGIDGPSAQGRMIKGPSIEWHPTLNVRSYGRYAVDRGRSIPHGTFTFWNASGHRRAQVTYEMGEPVGCAAMWDENGDLQTGFVEGDRFRGARCELEIDEEATEIALQNGFPASSAGPLAAVDVGTVLGGDEIPLSNDSSFAVSLQHNVRIAITHSLGWVGVGLTGHVRSGDYQRYVHGGAPLVTLSIPTPLPRVRVAASAELGIRRYTGRAHMSGAPAVESNQISTIYAGLSSGISVQLTKTLSVQVSSIVEYDGERLATFPNLFCLTSCVEGETTWKVGGTVIGALVGVQFRIY